MTSRMLLVIFGAFTSKIKRMLLLFSYLVCVNRKSLELKHLFVYASVLGSC